MKKLLIIAYDYPPYVSVGGLRPHSWFKYFNQFGVYPIIVTRQWDNKYQNSLDYIAPSQTNEVIEEVFENGTIIRTPYKPNLANRLLLKHGNNRFRIIRKLVSAYYEIMQYMLFVGPKAGLYHAAKAYLKNNKVDCIIATAEPFILFKYAAVLGKEFNTPWIADYRDPWSSNRDVQKNIVLKYWFYYLEKKIVSTATCITTVSGFFESKIAVRVKNRPFYIIPNGYDPQPIEAVNTIVQGNTELNIAFVGTILEWHPLKHTLKAIAEFIAENPGIKFKLNFYGINLEDEVKSIVAENTILANHVVIIPKLENSVLIQELAKNNVMLLFNYYSYMGTKIYDYIGIRRLILLCYSNDAEANALKEKYYNLDDKNANAPQLQTELLNETQAGVVVKDAAHLKQNLGMLYNEFKATGQVACNSVNINQFSRQIQTGRLAEIIKDIKHNAK